MAEKRKIGVMGGSFNPVHRAHIALADYICQSSGLDGVWLTLSPDNPLKQSVEKAPETDRLNMLEIACKEWPRLEACDIELTLPRPSYTINTLNELAERYDDCQFTLIVGADNLKIFDRWRSHQEIIDRYGLIVYPRPGFEIDAADVGAGVKVVDAPMIDMSSTMIRRAIAQGGDVNNLLSPGVYNYIKEHNLYRDKSL